MSDAATSLQKAIRKRLIESFFVTALVPAGSILDSNQRPAPKPSIMLGEMQVVDPGILIDRSATRVHATLHIWKTEPSLEGVKLIAGEVWRALKAPRLVLGTDWECGDCRISDTRFLRDPNGEDSHGIVSIDALIRELVS